MIISTIFRSTTQRDSNIVHRAQNNSPLHWQCLTTRRSRVDKKGGLLKRNPRWVRNAVQPPLPGATNAIDKQHQLVPTEKCLEYHTQEALCETMLARRTRDAYDSMGFAQILFREPMMGRARLRSLRPRMHTLARGRGCEVFSLLPAQCVTWWAMLEDVWRPPAVIALRDQMLQGQTQNEEFTALSLDVSAKPCETFSVWSITEHLEHANPMPHSTRTWHDTARWRCVGALTRPSS